MTFTRARHNPLSLVILNERRFCASEGPRRAARTGVPITPAFGVMGWAMPRVLCEAILARLAHFLMILVRSSSAEPRAKPRGRNLLFPVPVIYTSSPTQKSEHCPSPLCKKGAALGPRLLSIYLLIGYQLPPGEWDTLSNFILSIE